MNTKRKHGKNVVQVVINPPNVAAVMRSRPSGLFQPVMKPTNCSTMIKGPGVVSASARPSMA
jgi:hypothetical protein